MYFIFRKITILFSVCIIPCRIVSALMCFSAVALAYMLRISLSYAITQMVVPPHIIEDNSTKHHPDICPPYDNEITSHHKPSNSFDSTGKYDWSQELQGLILSSFYWVISSCRILFVLHLLAVLFEFNGKNINFLFYFDFL